MKATCPKNHRRCDQVEVPRNITMKMLFYCLKCRRYFDEDGYYNKWTPEGDKT